MSNQFPSMIILGATGSVGRQAADVAIQHGVQVDALSANKSVLETEKMVRMLAPKACAMADEQSARDLAVRISDLSVKVYAGQQGICEMIAETQPTCDRQVVVNSILGQAGLSPTIATLQSGKQLALANKESLVVAGEIVMPLAKQQGIDILPVDSEHCAIYQCLRSGDRKEIRRIMLTASGGPFYGYSREQLQGVTKKHTLAHPTWNMGAKITVDSATMMNKGFEVIEARWLFDIPVEKIQVLVHPQSVVHSAVQFVDGSVKAQLGTPDMRMPIQYALTYPERWQSDVPRLDLFATQNLTFEEPDLQRFPNLTLAYEAMNRGGNMPCVLNAANEVVNQAFRDGKCGFLQMSDVIANTMERTTFIAEPSYEDYVQTDKEARTLAMKLLKLF